MRYKRWLVSLRHESYQILQSFVDVASLVLKDGGGVSFKWPAYCHGWDIPLLRNFFDANSFNTVRVDGCVLRNPGRLLRPMPPPF